MGDPPTACVILPYRGLRAAWKRWRCHHAWSPWTNDLCPEWGIRIRTCHQCWSVEVALDFSNSITGASRDAMRAPDRIETVLRQPARGVDATPTTRAPDDDATPRDPRAAQ